MGLVLRHEDEMLAGSKTHRSVEKEYLIPCSLSNIFTLTSYHYFTSMKVFASHPKLVG